MASTYGVSKSIAQGVIDDIEPSQITEQACINYAKEKGYRVSEVKKLGLLFIVK